MNNQNGKNENRNGEGRGRQRDDQQWADYPPDRGQLGGTREERPSEDRGDRWSADRSYDGGQRRSGQESGGVGSERSWSPGYSPDESAAQDGGRSEGYGRSGDSQGNYGSQRYGSREYAGAGNRGYGHQGGYPLQGDGSWSGPGTGSWSSPGSPMGRGMFGGGTSDQQQRGRPPKGYKRSDDRIKEDLIEAIIGQGMDASEIDVNVQNGEVTFSGSVQNRQLRFRLEHLADSLSGVNEVHNNIRVKREGSSSSSGSSTSGSSGASDEPGTSTGTSTDDRSKRHTR